MQTTTLLVEIVIVGFSFFLAVVPALSLILNIDPSSILISYTKVPIQFQLAASFSAGVVWNRICDQIFHSFDERIIRGKFPSREVYQRARIHLVLQGESIRDYIGNYRSLIRVVRATTVLLAIYAVALPIYLIGSSQPIALDAIARAIIFLSELLLLSASIYAWFRLERGYVAAIYDAYTIIEEQKGVE